MEGLWHYLLLEELSERREALSVILKKIWDIQKRLMFKKYTNFLLSMHPLPNPNHGHNRFQICILSAVLICTEYFSLQMSPLSRL